ncbi:LysR family transcriptional regulator [Klebsiella oxytoca]|uniref:LysR family transcriptional regulator n=1 Tax=Klebsiella oxytoca TaxID=571 RepID=UPI003570F199
MYTSVQGIDLRLLHIFITIAQCKGFSAAQAHLNMSQSAISASMAALETRLGYRLCERGRRGFHLTEEGKRILESAQDLFSSLEHFVSRVRGLSGRLFGQLSIGLLDSTLTLKDACIYQAISRFYRRNQDVNIQLYIKSPTELEQAILDGQIHAAISYTGRRVTNLQYVKLFSERISIYCGRGHPLFRKPDVMVGDIRQAKWVKRGYLMPQHLVPLVPDDDQMTAIAHQMEGVALMILAGTHLGYLPQHYAKTWTDKGEMRVLNAKTLSYEAQHYLIFHRTRPHNEALEVFISDVLNEHLFHKN